MVYNRLQDPHMKHWLITYYKVMEKLTFLIPSLSYSDNKVCWLPSEGRPNLTPIKVRRRKDPKMNFLF